MQCPGSLRRPLRDVIKSIGRSERGPHCSSSTTTTTTTTKRDATSWTHSTKRPRCPIAATRPTTAFRTRQSSTVAAAQQPEQIDSETKTSLKIRRPLTTVPPLEFDAIVSDAAASRERDGRQTRMKDASEFSTRYFKTQYKRHQFRSEKAARGFTRQEQRDAGLWRAIIHTLDQASPSGKSHYHKRTETVKLPEGVQARFKQHVGAAILEIMNRTQCHVQISAEFSVEGRTDAFTGLLLQGSPSAISEAIELLPTMVYVPRSKASGDSTTLSDYTLLRETRQSEGGLSEESLVSNVGIEADRKPAASEPAPVHSVWAENRTHPQRPDREKLNRFKLFSPIDFTAYVRDLITSTPRSILRQLDNDSETEQTAHIHNVLKDLVLLYSNPRLNKLATSEAVDLTYQYCTKYNQYAYIREIYKSLEECGYKFTSSNFSVLLFEAARKGDIHNFDYTLRVMLRKKLSPTALTWASLHDLVRRRFPKQTALLVSTMRSKGLFEDNKTMIAVLKNTIQEDLMAHLARDGDIESFIKHYDDRVGTIFHRRGFQWLNDDTLNLAIDILLSLGRTQNAFQILAEFRNRGLEKAAANTATLNIFVAQTHKDRDPTSAVAALKHFYVGHPGALVPDQITYELLFFIAWNRRYFNMLRVIWRYACVAGHVSHDMEVRIRGSLSAYALDGVGLTLGRVWRAWVGKFVVGVARDLSSSWLAEDDEVARKENSSACSLDESEERLVELAGQSQFEKGSAESWARYAELKQKLQDDLNQVRNCAPTRPFGEALDEAWQEDVRWKEEQLASHKNFHGVATFAEMMRRGVRVGMRVGDFTKDQRKWEVPWLLGPAIREAKLNAPEG